MQSSDINLSADFRSADTSGRQDRSLPNSLDAISSVSISQSSLSTPNCVIMFTRYGHDLIALVLYAVQFLLLVMCSVAAAMVSYYLGWANQIVDQGCLLYSQPTFEHLLFVEEKLSSTKDAADTASRNNCTFNIAKIISENQLKDQQEQQQPQQQEQIQPQLHERQRSLVCDYCVYSCTMVVVYSFVFMALYIYMSDFTAVYNNFKKSSCELTEVATIGCSESDISDLNVSEKSPPKKTKKEYIKKSNLRSPDFALRRILIFTFIPVWFVCMMTFMFIMVGHKVWLDYLDEIEFLNAEEDNCARNWQNILRLNKHPNSLLYTINMARYSSCILFTLSSAKFVLCIYRNLL